MGTFWGSLGAEVRLLSTKDVASVLHSFFSEGFAFDRVVETLGVN